ncbi:MAG: hypothetical protein AAB405_02165 [Patescibacteria group bacterium]
MPLEEAILTKYCEGPAGLCDAAENDCFKCNSINRDIAFKAVKTERENKFLSLLFWGNKK